MGAGGSEDRSVLTRPASAPDTVVACGPDDGQVADIRFACASSTDRPLLVVVHGGFWRPEYDRAHVRPMTEALAAAGWASMTPEYRRVPGRPELAVADVHEAVRGIGALPGLADRPVLLVGHSAGGHLVLQAAATLVGRHAPVGVLALAPVADLRRAQALRLDGNAVQAFLGTDAAARPEFDPALLPTPAGKVRIVHGKDDGIVPLEVSESYLRRHPEAVLITVDGGHFDLIDPRSATWPAVPAALDALGGPP